MTDRVNMPVEPFGSGLWSSLQEAEKEFRRWGEMDGLAEFVLDYKYYGSLRRLPCSDREWYPFFVHFIERWYDKVSYHECYDDWEERCWEAYQEGVRFVWRWMKQAVALVECIASQDTSGASERMCLRDFLSFDLGLLPAYSRALKKISEKHMCS